MCFIIGILVDALFILNSIDFVYCPAYMKKTMVDIVGGVTGFITCNIIPILHIDQSDRDCISTVATHKTITGC